MPPFQAERVNGMRALGTLGCHLCHGLYEHPRHDDNLPDPPASDPKVSPALAIDFAVHLEHATLPAARGASPGRLNASDGTRGHSGATPRRKAAPSPASTQRTCRWGACRKDH